MTQFITELTLGLIAIIGFGYLIGYLYAKARARESYEEKIVKLTNIINEKNETIIKVKSDLRILQRTQSENDALLLEKEKELKHTRKLLDELKQNYGELENLIKEIQKDFQMIKHDKELLLKELREKKQLLKNQDNIIVLLEKKIKELSHEF